MAGPATAEPDYRAIDAHALNAPAEATRSPQALAAYLVGPARNQREKVRSIFRWITENIRYDVEGLRTGQPGPLDPEAVLADRRAVCSGYASLFEQLAHLGGLTAVTINGFSKGYDYQIGQPIGPSNHAWNGVEIDGTWFLLDATWGAGGLLGGRWKKQLDEGYFLTPPSIFIYTHLPEDERWQLLPKPIKTETFQRQVHLKPHFFRSGLQLGEQTQGVLEAEDRVQIDLVGSGESLVKAVLRHKERDLPETYALAQKLGDQVQLCAAFPQAGEYLLRLFAKKRGDAGPYQWALDYKIEAQQGAERAGFPQIYQAFVTRGAYIYTPRRHYLTSAAKHTFKIKVPGAEQVAVVQNERWQPLAETDGVYQGKIAVAPGPVGVYAKFPGDKTFSGLLQYIGD